jgi:arsenical pump membrane protein
MVGWAAGGPVSRSAAGPRAGLIGKLDKYAYLISVLIVRGILAAVAVGALAVAPASPASLLAVGGAAALDVALGAAVGPAIAVTAPLLAFLAAAMTLASVAERSGLGDRVARALARWAGGRSWGLYALTCVSCALTTAVVSLDGAVVLLVPLVVTLHRRFGAPLAPLFLGVVVVANVASVAVPQGNPTNLVVMDRSGVSAETFLAHMLGPGAGAAVMCGALLAAGERVSLRLRYRAPARMRSPLSAAERHAVLALVASALAAWIAPLVGVAPWWPFVGVVAGALALRPSAVRLRVPWRVGAQVGGLVVVTQAVGARLAFAATGGTAALLAVALATGLLAAVANNLPAGVGAASVLAGGPVAYAAAIGLAAGALATPQGSVATLVAADVAGPSHPPLRVRRLAPLAVAATMTAVLLLRPTL